MRCGAPGLRNGRSIFDLTLLQHGRVGRTADSALSAPVWPVCSALLNVSPQRAKQAADLWEAHHLSKCLCLQVRRLLEHAGAEVQNLKRVRIGSFALDRLLGVGKFRLLKPKQAEAVLQEP